MKKSFIILLLCYLPFVRLQGTTGSTVTTGTIPVTNDPTPATTNNNIFRCGAVDNTIELSRNDETVVCLHMLPFRVKIPYKVKVDHYTVLEIDGAYDSFKNLNNDNVDIIAQMKQSSLISRSVVKNNPFLFVARVSETH